MGFFQQVIAKFSSLYLCLLSNMTAPGCDTLSELNLDFNIANLFANTKLVRKIVIKGGVVSSLGLS